LNLIPSPLWGRGWTATGAFSSRGGPGEGVPTSSSSTIRRRCAGCRRSFIGGPAVNAVPLLPIPTVSRSRRSRWIRLSWLVPVVFVGFTVLTPSPACGPKPTSVSACGCPFGGRRPVAPRLMRTPVARHPLPQGGEGWGCTTAIRLRMRRTVSQMWKLQGGLKPRPWSFYISDGGVPPNRTLSDDTADHMYGFATTKWPRRSYNSTLSYEGRFSGRTLAELSGGLVPPSPKTEFGSCHPGCPTHLKSRNPNRAKLCAPHLVTTFLGRRRSRIILDCACGFVDRHSAILFPSANNEAGECGPERVVGADSCVSICLGNWTLGESMHAPKACRKRVSQGEQ
jgi:hypothetical protein